MWLHNQQLARHGCCHLYSWDHSTHLWISFRHITREWVRDRERKREIRSFKKCQFSILTETTYTVMQIMFCILNTIHWKWTDVEKLSTAFVVHEGGRHDFYAHWHRPNCCHSSSQCSLITPRNLFISLTVSCLSWHVVGTILYLQGGVLRSTIQQEWLRTGMGLT